MPETGSGATRAWKVLRKRISELWPASAGKIWWPEVSDFTPPASGSILRAQRNRHFENVFGVGGGSSLGQGSVSLVHGIPPGPGSIEAQEECEAAVRAIAHPQENEDAEDVTTSLDIEINPDVTPRGAPDSIAKAYSWTQYVVAYRISEGFP